MNKLLTSQELSDLIKSRGYNNTGVVNEGKHGYKADLNTYVDPFFNDKVLVNVNGIRIEIVPVTFNEYEWNVNLDKYVVKSTYTGYFYMFFTRQRNYHNYDCSEKDIRSWNCQLNNTDELFELLEMYSEI